MSDVVDSVNQVLQNGKTIEESSFYIDYQNFLKLYTTLIQDGITQRRESQLKTIQDQVNSSPFSYNTANTTVVVTSAR